MKFSYLITIGSVIAEEEVEAQTIRLPALPIPVDAVLKIQGDDISAITKDPRSARPYDVSDAMYTCPKSGYALIDDECVYETRIESRFDCPPGYAFNGILCETFQPIQWRCQNNGAFINGKCQHLEVYEAELQCPLSSSLGPDGICSSLEPVNYIDICPAGTIRSPAGCLSVDYHDPVLVCPSDTYIDGRKCRREVITYRHKKARLLSEDVDESEVEDVIEGERADDLDEELEGENDLQRYMRDPMTNFAYVLDPLHNMDYVPSAQWLPAESLILPTQQLGLPTAEYLNSAAWGTIPVGRPFPEASALAAPPPILAQPQKINKALKKAVQPQQMVKVISQAAEKVCPIGTRYGSTCVSETVLPTMKECPLPTIDGACVRRVATAPIATCPFNALLNCVGRNCRCEILRESLPFPTCRTNGFEIYSEDQCVHQVIPRRLCPLGFFLDVEDNNICARRDVEPALTLFSVTYACADCNDQIPALTPVKKVGGRRPNTVAATAEIRTDRRPRRQAVFDYADAESYIL